MSSIHNPTCSVVYGDVSLLTTFKAAAPPRSVVTAPRMTCPMGCMPLRRQMQTSPCVVNKGKIYSGEWHTQPCWLYCLRGCLLTDYIKRPRATRMYGNSVSNGTAHGTATVKKTGVSGKNPEDRRPIPIDFSMVRGTKRARSEDESTIEWQGAYSE